MVINFIKQCIWGALTSFGVWAVTSFISAGSEVSGNGVENRIYFFIAGIVVQTSIISFILYSAHKRGNLKEMAFPYLLGHVLTTIKVIMPLT